MTPSHCKNIQRKQHKSPTVALVLSPISVIDLYAIHTRPGLALPSLRWASSAELECFPHDMDETQCMVNGGVTFELFANVSAFKAIHDPGAVGFLA